VAADSFGLHGFNLFDSAAGIEHFLDDFVGGLSGRGGDKNKELGQ